MVTSLGSKQKSTREGQEAAGSGIKVALLEQSFHVGCCFPKARWEVDVSAGEMTLQHIVRLVGKTSSGFGWV